MQSFGGETCKKEPLRSPRRRWKDNIKRDQDLDGGEMDWIDRTQNRDRWWAVVNAVVKLQVP